MVYLGQNRVKYSLREYLMYGGLTLAIVLLIVIYVFEFDDMNRTLHFRYLAYWSIAIGAFLGALIGWWVGRDKKDFVDRLQIFLFFAILVPLFSPLWGSASNRLFSRDSPRLIPCEIIELNAFMADRFGKLEGEKARIDGFYLFFRKNGELHRVELPADWQAPDQIKQGKIIDLSFKKGLWGYDIFQLRHAH